MFAKRGQDVNYKGRPGFRIGYQVTAADHLGQSTPGLLPIEIVNLSESDYVAEFIPVIREND